MSDNETMIKDKFVKRYCIERDECGDYQIPLRNGRGHVYAHAKDELAAEIQTEQPRRTFNAIKRKCPAASIHVEGDFKIIIRHPLESADKFLAACGARTKRRLSEKERQRLNEIGR